MNTDNDHKYIRVNKLVLLVAVLILGAGVLGWRLGPSNISTTSQPNNTNQPTTVNNADTAGVKSQVNYVLPDGWKEASCPGTTGSVYVVPAGASNADCDANPSSAIKISVDPANNTDCNQLQNVQNVSKHICISEYINGNKTLKAETIYNQASSYKKPTTINAYYINTGKGVIKVEYVHGSDDNGYQAGFDQLAKSVQVKWYLNCAWRRQFSSLTPNQNARAPLTIEVTFSGSSKHILGDMLNASAIGLYGIVVGRPEMMPKIKRNAEYIKQITKLEKQQISF